MKIIFLGTRGYIKARTPSHYRHTSTLIIYKGKRLLIDCGLDWLNKVDSLKPDAIIITHAHPDHAWGLKEGSPCPVYATKDTWNVIENFPIKERVVIDDREVIRIGHIAVEVFAEVHSIRCPAVGYRITAGKVSIFYAGDVVSINQRAQALKNIHLYIGDGATIVRSMVRRRGDQLFGHTPIRTQLGWCQKEKVPRAIITHCGTQIVAGDQKKVLAQVQKLGKERGVAVTIAYDGLTIILR